MFKVTIDVGDTFTKVNSVDTVWVVDRVLSFTDAPLHFRLVEQGGNDRTATIAYAALVNPKLWKPLKKNS